MHMNHLTVHLKLQYLQNVINQLYFDNNIKMKKKEKVRKEYWTNGRYYDDKSKLCLEICGIKNKQKKEKCNVI